MIPKLVVEIEEWDDPTDAILFILENKYKNYWVYGTQISVNAMKRLEDQEQIAYVHNPNTMGYLHAKSIWTYVEIKNVPKDLREKIDKESIEVHGSPRDDDEELECYEVVVTEYVVEHVKETVKYKKWNVKKTFYLLGYERKDWKGHSFLHKTEKTAPKIA